MSYRLTRLVFFLAIFMMLSACSTKQEQLTPLAKQTPKTTETRSGKTPAAENSSTNKEQQTESATNIEEALSHHTNEQTQQAQSPTQSQSATSGARPEFDRFVAQIKNGNPQQIVGVYIENVLALRVMQQPPNDPNYVSSVKGIATQFLLAYQAPGQNIGLLAHNYLSGTLFFNIKVGNVAQLIYGDGRVEEYEVTDYREYQAITPDSPTSDFLDLTSGQKLSAGELFQNIYTGEHHLIFQTCINQDNISTWGRLFVLSFPY